MKNLIKLSIGLQLAASMALADEALIVKDAGRPASSDLHMKSSLVPTYDVYQKKVVHGKTEVYKVKTIPALDIGQERRVSAAKLSPLRLPASESVTLAPLRRHPATDVLNFDLKSLTDDVTALKPVTTPDAFDKIPNVKPLEAVQDPVVTNSQPNAVKIEEMPPNDYKMLQALIFLEVKKNYELAMGLFAELMQDPAHRIEALYHYAMTAKGLNLNSEFRQTMITVVKESKDKNWRLRAGEALVQNINILETSDIAMIDPLVKELEIDTTKNDDYNIARAKYYSEKGDLGRMEESLVLIDEKSPRYPDSLLLSALASYRQGKVDEAIVPLQTLLTLTEGNKQAPMRSIGALTLARIQFQKSLYKDAFQSYLKVDKSDPLWLQAMIEQAWTQILSEDYEGAAGNMFSLHTDFFKNAFSPESYVVRTVGYLNLCQYGDGIQVLSDMRRKYSPWKTKLAAYTASHKQAQSYYDTVKAWIKNSDLKEVDGLPRSFIVELARHPSYLNVQKQINNYEDEVGRFNKIAMTLIKQERELIAKQNVAVQDVTNAKKSGSAEKIQAAEKQLMSYRIQYHIAKTAWNSIKNLRGKAVARIEKEKGDLREKAGKALQGRYQEMVANLDKVLEQNDVLQYELYAGAGEHIRYQMAGGQINEKERPELTADKQESLQWKFKGEIWEDEVGHYRSSLKNVCPQEGSVAAGNTEQ